MMKFVVTAPPSVSGTSQLSVTCSRETSLTSRFFTGPGASNTFTVMVTDLDPDEFSADKLYLWRIYIILMLYFLILYLYIFMDVW